MKITTHNYEIFFIDYFDGNLTKSQEEELFLFLENNPKLKTEFDEFENIQLIPEEEAIFDNKNVLRLIPENSIFCITENENLCISDIENDITESEKNNLQLRLKNNSELEKDYNLFKQTKLKADTSIIFKHKNRIKRNVIPMGMIRTAMASAAAILLFALVFTQMYNTDFSNSGTAINNIDYSFSGSKTAIVFQPNTTEQNTQTQNNYNSQKIVNKENNLVNNSETEQDSLQNAGSKQFPEINTKVKQQRIFVSENNSMPIAKVTITKPAVVNTTEKKSIKQQINLWKIAESGVKTWNAVTSSNAKMNNNYTQEGEIENVSFSYKKLKLSRSFNKNKY